MFLSLGENIHFNNKILEITWILAKKFKFRFTFYFFLLNSHPYIYKNKIQSFDYLNNQMFEEKNVLFIKKNNF